MGLPQSHVAGEKDNVGYFSPAHRRRGIPCPGFINTAFIANSALGSMLVPNGVIFGNAMPPICRTSPFCLPSHFVKAVRCSFHIHKRKNPGKKSNWSLAGSKLQSDLNGSMLTICKLRHVNGRLAKSVFSPEDQSILSTTTCVTCVSWKMAKDFTRDC